ncbi:methyltransferase [Anatilimnocola floriformis]|uniref:methyltransferase n=1 Tax=Anatilimnocola floriformis TaxID=2948575 RepID=UPI0020C4314C|nr:methyltransferase [Anatilimnocola floriformis]
MPSPALPRSLYPVEPPRPAEQLLIDYLPKLKGERVLCTTLGRGQFATAVADRNANARVVCWFLDLFAQQQSAQQIGARSDQFQLLCQPNPPDEKFDLAALPFQRQGEVELVRDQLQLAHERLDIGGTLVASTDNATDSWLNEQLQALFDKVSRHAVTGGVIYVAVKNKPLKKMKNFACEFAFRDNERLIHLRSRPGVFSHRSLDTGARALMESMHLTPGVRVLDIGCGSGAVAMAAALRGEGITAHGIDSNPRAVEALQWAAARNETSAVTASVDCDGSTLEPGTFDLAVGNPPYYSNFRLAEIFIEVARKALKPDGELLLVTKMPDWYERNLSRWFSYFEPAVARQFHVFHCGNLVSGAPDATPAPDAQSSE